MTRPDFDDQLSKYPELLRWTHMKKITGFSRRTLERRRAKRKLEALVFIDQFEDGCLQVTKASMVAFLERQWERTQQKLTPPSLMDARNAV